MTAAVTDFSVTASTNFLPDRQVFTCWLHGWPVEEVVSGTFLLQESGGKAATDIRCRNHKLLLTPEAQRRFQIPPLQIVDFLMVKKWVLDQYRHFDILEHYLHRPQYLHTQIMVPLPIPIMFQLVEMYYTFDDVVVRELVSAKFSSRSRKDLDDACAKTGYSIGTCKRQFDNMKRISKRTEAGHGRLADIIQSTFILPVALARLDTTKKKLQSYSLADFEYGTSVFMRLWCATSTDSTENFDSAFVSDLRDIRQTVLYNKDVMDEYRNAVVRSITALRSCDNTERSSISSTVAASTVASNMGTPSVASPSVMQTSVSMPFRINILGFIDSSLSSSSTSSTSSAKDTYALFKIVLRNMITLGTGLALQKEIRDLFVDVVEKIVEPFLSAGWSVVDMEQFFGALLKEWTELQTLREDFRLSMVTSWERLVTGVQLTASRFFPGNQKPSKEQADGAASSQI